MSKTRTASAEAALERLYNNKAEDMEAAKKCPRHTIDELVKDYSENVITFLSCVREGIDPDFLVPVNPEE